MREAKARAEDEGQRTKDKDKGQMTVANRANLALIEDYYERWQSDPSSVDQSWRNFFEGYDLGRSIPTATAGSEGVSPAPAQEAVKAVTRLVDAYREMGHYLADLDPLKLVPRPKTYE
jgi:2-oxoglutarate dehydrogenase E1 component